MTRDSTRGIPWVRLFAESVAIIASILLAFAIDAWWDARQDTEREREYLVALQEEFAVAKADLEEDIAVRTEMDRLGRELLVAGRTASPPPDDSIATWIREFSRLRLFAPSLGVFEDLLSSGGLAALGSDRLRVALLEYDQQRRRLRMQEDREASTWEDHLRPYLATRTAALPSTVPGETIRSAHPTGYAAVLSDRTFESHVANRLHRLTIVQRWSDSTMVAIDHVLGALAATR